MNILLAITTALCAIFVESFSGQVTVKPQGTEQWMTPTKQQTLDRRDSIQLPHGTKLIVVDNETGRLYTFSSPEKGNINQCLVSAKASVHATLRSLAYQMKANAMGQNRQAHSQSVYGGTIRSMSPELRDYYNERIACAMLAAAKQNKPMMPDVQLRSIDNDGFISFAIDNNSNDSCYINILAVNDANSTVSLCIVPTPDMDEDMLLLPPSRTMELPMFQFVPQPNVRYVLIALSLPYIPAEEEQLLKHPEDLDCQQN